MTGEPARESATTSPDAAGVVPSDPVGELTELGAAATLPDQRRRDRRRRRRADLRHTSQSSRSTSRSDGPDHDPGFHSDVEYVFEPGGGSATPLRPYLRSVWERRHFMGALARSAIRGKRSSASLGAVWSVLDPLFQAGIYFMLFTIIRRGGRPIEFLPILIGGMFMFQLALSALQEGGRSLKSSKSLVLNSTFPRAIFPVTTVLQGVMTLPSKVGVYLVIALLLGAPFGWGLLLFPALFAVQVILMVGVALLVSTVVVMFKDADNAVQYVGRIMFFTTPVIYPVTLLPDSLHTALSFQPYFALFASYQVILDGGVPGLWQMTQAVIWAVVLLMIGLRVFRRHEHEFAMRL